jgi:hypothetical protein
LCHLAQMGVVLPVGQPIQEVVEVGVRQPEQLVGAQLVEDVVDVDLVPPVDHQEAGKVDGAFRTVVEVHHLGEVVMNQAILQNAEVGRLVRRQNDEGEVGVSHPEFEGGRAKAGKVFLPEASVAQGHDLVDRLEKNTNKNSEMLERDKIRDRLYREKERDKIRDIFYRKKERQTERKNDRKRERLKSK